MSLHENDHPWISSPLGPHLSPRCTVHRGKISNLTDQWKEIHDNMSEQCFCKYRMLSEWSHPWGQSLALKGSGCLTTLAKTCVLEYTQGNTLSSAKSFQSKKTSQVREIWATSKLLAAVRPWLPLSPWTQRLVESYSPLLFEIGHKDKIPARQSSLWSLLASCWSPCGQSSAMSSVAKMGAPGPRLWHWSAVLYDPEKKIIHFPGPVSLFISRSPESIYVLFIFQIYAVKFISSPCSLSSGYTLATALCAVSRTFQGHTSGLWCWLSFSRIARCLSTPGL